MMMPYKTLCSILAVMTLNEHSDARQNLLERFDCFEITSA
jgi:hypothetical protein